MYKVMQPGKRIRLLLLPIGIIGVLVITPVVPLIYTPDTSAPFPYIRPPEGPQGYYLEATPEAIASNFATWYQTTADYGEYAGLSFICRNIKLEEWFWKTESYIYVKGIRCEAEYPSELRELKEGDVIDIIGIYVCPQKEGGATLTNCRFLPPGTVPLLPGGPAPVASKY